MCFTKCWYVDLEQTKTEMLYARLKSYPGSQKYIQKLKKLSNRLKRIPDCEDGCFLVKLVSYPAFPVT